MSVGRRGVGQAAPKGAERTRQRRRALRALAYEPVVTEDGPHPAVELEP